MSREERRNYQRMMKNMDRAPALPPAARARAERKAAQRQARRGATLGEPARFDRGFWTRTVVIALVIGLIGFSLQWGEGMPYALYVGLAAGGGALLVLIGIRYLQRRASSNRTSRS